MSYKLSQAALYSAAKGTDQHILIALSDVVPNQQVTETTDGGTTYLTGKCHPSKDYLANVTGYSIATIKRVRKSLRAKGFIDYDGKSGVQTLYTIIIPVKRGQNELVQNEPVQNELVQNEPIDRVKMNPLRGQNEPIDRVKMNHITEYSNREYNREYNRATTTTQAAAVSVIDSKEKFFAWACESFACPYKRAKEIVGDMYPKDITKAAFVEASRQFLLTKNLRNPSNPAAYWWKILTNGECRDEILSKAKEMSVRDESPEIKKLRQELKDLERQRRDEQDFIEEYPAAADEGNRNIAELSKAIEAKEAELAAALAA